MTGEFDRDEADELSTDIVEQVMLRAAEPEGEA